MAIVDTVRRLAIASVLAALAVVPPAPVSAAPPIDAASPPTEPATPVLIDEAQEERELSLERATLLRVYALTGDDRLPAAYESDRPFDGTFLLKQAREALPSMDPGQARRRVATALRSPPDPNDTTCGPRSASPPRLPSSTETEHFYVQYDAAALDPSLSIADYTQSLETAWTTEVDAFAWAAPPAGAAAQVELGGKYHVRIEALPPGLYGLVSNSGTYAARVGDNPNTPGWLEFDADATCMVLNQNYDEGFFGVPRSALDATSAHEFNHSLQFGYGALGDTGNEPDLHFAEGAATWMEDEVQDAANDNYNYLYPLFTSSMGEHKGDEYAFWHTFRGLTERFGTGVAGGGEDVMQGFWERTSRGEPGMLTSLQDALSAKGGSLAGGYHDYAIAAKFNAPCGGAYTLPHCFEEGQAYVDFDPEDSRPPHGETQPHGAVTAVGASYSGSVEDNYALNWITLPVNATFPVTLSNTSVGGALRATVACDTGAAITRTPLPAPLGPGTRGTVDGVSTQGCREAVAVITNEAQTAANPSFSQARTYTLSTAPPPSRLTIGRVNVRPSGIVLVRAKVSGAGTLKAVARARVRRPPLFRLRRLTAARRTIRTTEAGTVTLRLKARRTARRLIRNRRSRRLRARATVVFEPAAGVRRTKSRTVTFRLKR